MELTDEIRKLKELHVDGTLTDAEFAQAKAALLGGLTSSRQRSDPDSSPEESSIGTAAKNFVKFQIVMGIVGVVLSLLFFFGFFLPQWNKRSEEFEKRWSAPLAPRTLGDK